MEYTVIIRTLGKAGEKFQTELNSLINQSIAPKEIIVYIAEGFAIPKETVGIERFVFVPKGMVAQRALTYDDISTPYVLFLDDDVFLPNNAVELLYSEMEDANADFIAPYVFNNHLASRKKKITQSLMGKEFCRILPDSWGYKVLRTSGFSYRNRINTPHCVSQTNTGPCFLCRLSSFQSIHFEDELWLDMVPYALPEDQVMFFKAFRQGFTQITSYDSGIVHLDAGSTLVNSPDRIAKLIYSEYRNKIIFWHRFFYQVDRFIPLKIWDIICLIYVLIFQTIKAFIKTICGNSKHASALMRGIKDGFKFLQSDQYKAIPPVIR